MVLSIYQKKNGELVKHITKFSPSYKIGEETAYGWILIDVKYRFKGKYYSLMEYDMLVNKELKKHKRFFNFKKKFLLLYKQLAYILTLLILVKILENSIIYNFV